MKPQPTLHIDPAKTTGIIATLPETHPHLAHRKLLTRKEACDVMGISLKLLLQLERSGKLATIRLGSAGRAIRIPLVAIDRYIEQEIG
jgi:excisionase family DNA binding protein